jgi:GNAT superfamily N-acetyltransferase
MTPPHSPPSIGTDIVDFTITVTDSADETIHRAIVGSLAGYNAQKTGTNDHRPLVMAINDSDGQVVGGLWGRTAHGWLFVELLFVPESLRGRGIGAGLMQRAESEAMERGCHSAWLDTFQFQARGFYERLGYSCFGELGDYPVGFSRYFMRKVLRNLVPNG